MTHEEKINYMRIATGVAGMGFTNEGLDLILSIYELVCEKKGSTDVHSIAKITAEVGERYKPKQEETK